MIKGKVILITGASSGIGYTTALTLSKAGATIIAGARRIDKLESLKEAIRDQNGEILINPLDVTNRQECTNLANSAIDKDGKIDVLINNAGLMPLSFVKN